ncbi:unnamed protein product [Eruca vesicaria subsp. sativa]|uniref:Protein kinase domain-containing protein n=1 Tax=Eruca vesicaria subsp. sativa TaxID=29727 RepID=A0ABC8LY50_ERUVS|nr:unnamed protein product [Eruca vesicaria subsp. sativa]
MGFLTCFGLRPKRKVVQKPKMKPVAVQEPIHDQPPSSSSANPARVSSDLRALLPPCDQPRKKFAYQQLATATNNFSLDSRIGQGGFGDVYKGKLEINGQLKDVAVKMLDPCGSQGNNEFLVEVFMLSIFRNKNLVEMYGYCCEDNQRSIVYEYMPLGSLEDCLHNFKSAQEVLDLPTRMKIALGAAKGLAYLHNVAKPAVIYRDMKTSNILLDNEFQPKLSDFGLAKIGPNDGMSHVTTRVMGTLGYCAPEYAATGRLTLKCDIYSFGVVILELFTGRKPFGDSSMGAHGFLAKWALPYYRNQNIKGLTDPMLARQGHPYLDEIVKRAVHLAFACLKEDAKARPAIGQVVKALEVLDEFIARKDNETSIQHELPIDKGKKVEGSTVYEEDEDFKRQRDIADATKIRAKGFKR